jgi:AcrR family transcriptional regulator
VSILNAAREQMAVQGAAMGMDDVARAAGLAVGTLYRHFPTKSDLLAAILDEQMSRLLQALDDALERVAAGSSAIVEFTLLIERISQAASGDRAVKETLARLGVQTPPEVTQRAYAGLELLLAGAHAEGTIRPDVTAGDLVLLLSGMPTDDLPEQARRRWLTLILRAVTTERAPAVSSAAPDGRS